MYLIIVQWDQHCMIGTNVETEGETSNSNLEVWEGLPEGDEVLLYIRELRVAFQVLQTKCVCVLPKSTY